MTLSEFTLILFVLNAIISTLNMLRSKDKIGWLCSLLAWIVLYIKQLPVVFGN